MGKTLKHNKFKKHGQFYLLDDETKAPSVTTVIGDNLGWNKNALMNWAKRQSAMGNDVDAMLSDAADTGTLLHLLIEAHQRGFDVDTRDFTANQEEAALVAEAFIFAFSSAAALHLLSHSSDTGGRLLPPHI